MSRYLMIDVGAGTMDVLYVDDASRLHYKAVVSSPVRTVAAAVARTEGNLLVIGGEMGGGPVSQVLIERTRKARVVMTAAAARTLSHDPDRVRSEGIEIIDDERRDAFRQDKTFAEVTLEDLEPDRLRQIVEGFGVSFSFDVVGVCLQDHGVPPPGISHLAFRHELYAARLDRDPRPHTLLFPGAEIPRSLNRLRSAAESAARLPTGEVFAMDSGMAAVLGASLDRACRSTRRQIVLDVATSHTVGAALEDGAIAGLFEYHTRDLAPDRLERLIRDLPDGTLSHDEILREGGHGAYLRKTLGFSSVEVILATGPKRSLVNGCSLPIVFGAPMGDNMMTGTAGLLEAIRRKEGLPGLSAV
jgi:uncharacterized protein (DUF1786 family)